MTALRLGDKVVAVRRRAVLVKRKTGRFKSKLECVCPYACLAAHEKCEFAPGESRERMTADEYWMSGAGGLGS